MNIVSLCTEIKAGAQAPEWIELLPAGPEINGRDGRSWRLTNPNIVVDAFKQQRVSMVVDYEHSTELTASKGVESPAAGWIEDVQVRDDGSVWGKVEWTPKAINSIVNKEYRFISPAFYHNADGNISRLTSAALTNKPNFSLTALNSEQEWGDVAIALGVDGISSPQDILKALNRVKVEDNKKIVDEFISLSVFIPSQRDALLAMCSQIGVDKFKEFAELQSTTTSFKYLSEKKSIGKCRPQQQLTDSQIAVCRQVGVSEDDYLIALGKQK